MKNTIPVWSIFLFLAIVSSLAGCAALQSATFSKPRIDNPTVEMFEYGDGIALRLPNICVAVREASPSAEYREVAWGPLFVTVVPTGTSSSSKDKLGYFKLGFDFAPNHDGTVTFDPRKTILRLSDGSFVRPYSYYVWHHFSSPEDWKDVEQLVHGIELRSTQTYVALRFKKSNDSLQMSELSLRGLHNAGELISVPTIMFEPRRTEYRYLYPGRFRTIDNIPIPTTIIWECKKGAGS